MNQFVLLGIVGIGVVFGMMAFGFTLQRMISKIYGRRSSRPRKVPPAHGQDRRPPGSSDSR